MNYKGDNYDGIIGIIEDDVANTSQALEDITDRLNQLKRLFKQRDAEIIILEARITAAYSYKWDTELIQADCRNGY